MTLHTGENNQDNHTAASKTNTRCERNHTFKAKQETNQMQMVNTEAKRLALHMTETVEQR